ncbi:hypothetical protein PAPYR_13168 [Paratrimastix pyriformis]|uniref:Uncharacterized protein n=1 Tax=Paratrimastix pyriformis TaxID=342808 RepID=A0ABQ8U5N6_9EUKA|nr:hypothetical protein PAPYR_13168 [Paratrimastix pyriformis]
MLDLLLFLFGRLVFLAGALGLLLSFIFGDSVQAKRRAGAASAADDLVQRAHVSSNGLAVPPPRSHPASDEESVTAAAARLTKFLSASAFLGLVAITQESNFSRWCSDIIPSVFDETSICIIRTGIAMFVGTKPYRRYGFSIEIEFSRCSDIIPSFFDETHRFASSEPVSRCLSVLKSIPAVWIFNRNRIFEVVF